jgi:CubicO group peptidase (beta-lactamase class C family)
MIRSANFVSGFPSDVRGQGVTIRHLLSHSAGLANPIPVGWVRPAVTPAADLHEFTGRLLRKHSRLRSDPGARASYSNLGYLVLGEVVEAASGLPYTEYVRSNILAPLAMSSRRCGLPPLDIRETEPLAPSVRTVGEHRDRKTGRTPADRQLPSDLSTVRRPALNHRPTPLA